MAGAPVGNTNARKAKKWQEALARALARVTKESVDAGLDKIAEQVVTQAMNGEKDAWKEIAERFDGKVPQGLIGGDEDDAPISLNHMVEFIGAPTAPPKA